MQLQNGLEFLLLKMVCYRINTHLFTEDFPEIMVLPAEVRFAWRKRA